MTSRRLERALSRSTIAVPETAGAEVPGSRTWIDRVVDPLHTWLQGTDGSVSLYAVIGRVREMGGSVPAALLMFKEVDTDGDGQLSSVELRTGLARAAHDPALQLLVQLAAACPNEVAPAVAARIEADGMGLGGIAERAPDDRAELPPSLAPSTHGQHPPLSTPPPPTITSVHAGTALTTRTLALVERLLADKSQPALPVRSHAERLSSGERGLSLAALRGLRAFFAAHNRLDVTMENVCKERGCETSVCALTRSTGLSLAESVVLVAAEQGKDTSALVGRATTFFSYSWTGTKLGDMLGAIEPKLEELEAADGVTRYVWVDMFAASQNLLAGVYRDDASHPRGTAGYKARKEDTDSIFDDALDAIGELLLYASPLTAEWLAPEHAFLLPERGEARSGWMRRGPGAMTRAWCMFEMVKALAKRATLHVVLAPADVAGFGELLVSEFDELAMIVANLDARDAQISKVEDREYILGQVAALDGGLGAVTARVCEAMNGWLVAQGEAELARLPAAERGTSVLLGKVALLLGGRGDYAAAEPLHR